MQRKIGQREINALPLLFVLQAGTGTRAGRHPAHRIETDLSGIKLDRARLFERPRCKPSGCETTTAQPAVQRRAREIECRSEERGAGTEGERTCRHGGYTEA